MTGRVLLSVLLLATAAIARGPEAADDIERKADEIIKRKCLSCHGVDRIDTALKAGRDMRMVIYDMQKRGTGLTKDEQEVLRVFWKRKPE
jgi:cytochrome c-type biogenesis protein CcmH/NrfF